MAVDLQTSDSSLPYDSLLPPSTDFTHSNNFNGSDSNPHILISPQFGSHTYSTTPHSTQPQKIDDDLFDELTMLQQEDHKFDSSDIDSDDWEPLKPLDSVSCWSQSSVWSPLCSNQGSSEGSLSPKEPSESANSHDSDCYDVLKMLDKMKFDESDDSSKSHHVGICSSNQYLLNEQIRANQLSRVRQEQILSLQQKLAAYRESNGHVSPQFQKKGKGTDVGIGMGGLQRTGSLNQQAGSEKPISQGDTGSKGTSCGTGVFLPRGGVSARFQSTSKRPGKGCSTVLIPERVVQALQLHFDQMAATSGPKPRGFPPLHDVLVSTNRDGMYSLQKRQSRKNQTHVQNDMILPGEWTY
ncbi:hypothetical protein L195_g009483 [Trifolium pratense]|uniref:Uncharacterized protein n=1 Tax=Trifolium pratense TaxID=57577 RepID=A0A2K3PC31_TRIPR|nr:hypothetical protein L195_g009483 [Trifolium pratense]